jgi:predicted nucleotide-binding protein
MRPEQQQILEKIYARIDLEIRSQVMTKEDLESLRAYVLTGATKAFGGDSVEVTRLRSALRQSRSRPGDEIANSNIRIKCAKAALQIIESIVEIDADFTQIDPALFEGAERVTRASNTKVFVVHGHDEVLRERTARFLEKANLEPIILAEQPGQSQTIIEKLEANSDVAFAIVLLTADDIGGPDRENLEARPRQNVVFELGYFVGLLTRARVTALVEEGIEMFSDIHGVNYIAVDSSGAWKNLLARELKVFGFDVDLEALI